MSDREWFRDHVIGYESGLLSDRDHERFQALLLEDDDCRELYDRVLAAQAAEPHAFSGEHLPVAFLASWPRIRDRLGRVEREIAERHLERCALCRGALELPTGPTHTASDAVVTALGTTGDARYPAATGHVRRRRWPALGSRLAAGWALVATAACAVLLVVRLGEESPAPEASVVPWVRLDSVRGQVAEVTASESDPEIVIVLPAELVPRRADWTLALVTDRDAVVIETPHLEEPDVLVVRVPRPDADTDAELQIWVGTPPDRARPAARLPFRIKIGDG